MNITPNENIVLDHIIDKGKSDEHLELEAILISNEVNNKKIFTDVMKRLKGLSFKESVNDYELDVYISREKDAHRPTNFPFRKTIVGLNDINKYCKTNILRSIGTDMYKKLDNDSPAERSGLLSKLASDNVKTDLERNKHMFNTLTLREFDIKFNIKKEVQLDPATYHSLQSVAQEVRGEYSEFLRIVQNIRLLKQHTKYYRLKKRFSFTDISGLMRIDLTIIRSSPTDSKTKQYIYTKTFKEAKIMSQPETYEIEIEYLGDSSTDTSEIKHKYFNTIGILLQVIQKSNVIISNSERMDVLYIYKEFIKTMVATKIKSHLELLTKVQKNESIDESILTAKEYNPLFKNIQFQRVGEYNQRKLKTCISVFENETRNLNMGKYPYNNDSTYFISPKPISLEMLNIRDTASSNILTNYSVTDKADGESMLLYILGLDHITNHIDILKQKLGDPTYSKTASQLNHKIQKMTTLVTKYSKLEGQMYMIDNNMRLRKTGSSHSSFRNTVMNGEFLDKDSRHHTIAQYMTYDLYYHNNTDLKSLPLLSADDSKKTRIQMLDTILQDTGYVHVDEAFKIQRKGFMIVTDGKYSNIFEKSNSIWSKFKEVHSYKPETSILSFDQDAKTSSYYLDGLIYTPIDDPVAYSDNYLYDIHIGKAWLANFKWKPPHDNTIDFFVKYKKHESGNSSQRIKKIGNQVIYEEYKTLFLYTGKNIIEGYQPCQDNSKKTKKYKPALFVPNQPYSKNAYIANLLCVDGDPICVQDKSVIREDSIVEFAFDMDAYNRGSDVVWIPLRTRNDKTDEYNGIRHKQDILFRILYKYMFWKTKELTPFEFTEINMLQEVIPALTRNLNLESSNQLIYMIQNYTNRKKLSTITSSKDIPLQIKYGNDYNVANQIWRIIHNPILEDIICTGTGVVSTEIEHDIYYNRDTTVSRTKSDSLSMQQFHNILVKRKAQIDIVKKMTTTSMNILDIGCGKGGDISKWIDVGDNILHVVGIDKSGQNILDVNDGACVRYDQIKEKKRGQRLPTFTFLVGDCSKNIFNGSCFSDDRSSDIYKRMWDQSMGLTTHFKQNKFNIINIQFAIHYFFESIDKLDGFIQNINQNLKQDGYLLGTCFDGNLVFNALRSLSKSEQLVGNHNNSILWKIKKEYDLEELPDDERSVGIPISVFIKSINNTIREYLVSFAYLQQRFANIGIRLISDNEARELGILKGTGTFKELYNQYKDDLKYNFIFNNFGPDQQLFSFMYRYFIFKRVSDGPIDLVDDGVQVVPIAPIAPIAPIPLAPVLEEHALIPEAEHWKSNVLQLIAKLKPRIDIDDHLNSRYLSSTKNKKKYDNVLKIINKVIDTHSDEFGPSVIQYLTTLHEWRDILNSRTVKGK